MAPIHLKKLLGKDGLEELGSLLTTVAEPIAILDADENLLVCHQPAEPGFLDYSIPIRLNERIIGWVRGKKDTAWPDSIASLVEYILIKETEKRDLAAEVLDKYRELHLLYRLAEKLSASLQPEAIASMTLGEVCPLIRADGGNIILRQQDKDEYQIQATCGYTLILRPDLHDSANLVSRVLSSGVAELANDLPAAEYFLDSEQKTVSLLCAPLKTEKGVLGVILLASGDHRHFTAGDLKLVNAIAMQTAPAIEIAYLHQLELEKTRLEHDLQMARQVQSALLPHKMPQITGWRVKTHWQPAREVSGDFYEFIHFSDQYLGLAIADVTGKGMPAALVMANTRSVLRAVAAASHRRRQRSPGKLLKRMNNILCEDMPRYMFVTCLLVILDTQSGEITFANAGHNLPYLRTRDQAIELKVTGMPLGLFSDIDYEEQKAILTPGDSLLMYSDGLTEAHNPDDDLFGYKRLQMLMEPQYHGLTLRGEALIKYLLEQLAAFTGPGWEQEDDVTFVVLDRDG